MLSEISRVLRPGGLLFLEFDAKWCIDSFWMALDSVIGNRIGYEVTPKEMRDLFGSAGGGMITWGFPDSDERVNIRFLTHAEIHSLLRTAGFQVIKQRSILLFGGLIPTVVQQETENKLLLYIASVLSRIDRLVGGLPLLRRFGGDRLILARKVS